MHWPQGEQIVRVDGKDAQSLLILREGAGLSRTQFTHDYLAELLRAAVVATVSALDRYMHDVVITHSWSLLTRAEPNIPKELKKLEIPILAARHAVDRLRKDKKARPGVLLKESLRDHMHKEYTFQRPDDVQKAAAMLGVKDFWGQVSAKMPGTPKKEAVMEQLRAIAARRNQIVHEADIVKKAKAKSVTMRDISAKTAAEWVTWMREFVGAVDSVVSDTV
jgi:hypothetical protein